MIRSGKHVARVILTGIPTICCKIEGALKKKTP